LPGRKTIWLRHRSRERGNLNWELRLRFGGIPRPARSPEDRMSRILARNMTSGLAGMIQTQRLGFFPVNCQTVDAQAVQKLSDSSNRAIK
jgi:hypothetical protein